MGRWVHRSRWNVANARAWFVPGILQQGYAFGYLLPRWLLIRLPIFGGRVFVAGALPALLVIYIARMCLSHRFGNVIAQLQKAPHSIYGASPGTRGVINLRSPAHDRIQLHVHGTQDLYSLF